MLNKIQGSLLGFAIGDAWGGVTEFMTPSEIREKYGSVDDYTFGGGVWNLAPGETTDDTAMTIAVAKGILACPEDPLEEIGKEFLLWRDSRPKDIGNIIQTAFDCYEGDWFDAALKTHEYLNGRSAGNGTLMRCLPIALYYSDPDKMTEITIQQSKMTHYDDTASEACVIYNQIARRLLEGEELKESIAAEVQGTRYEGIFEEEPDCPADGYVVHTLKWVLHYLWRYDSYKKMMTAAANKGGDSDTIAAIAGGLKGIHVGLEGLGVDTSRLLGEKELMTLGERIYRSRLEVKHAK
ncbi:ADP-ribosylglycohydrolase family protein [Fictibacillus aquaticus]|uniref:ADP-ribosyl-[dinitrogen reductase] hydrolase n=1 Tax=Fictibacillus aquaticus TaxID=2021314 RepID=A0A235F9D8_9BACL|nr:ADP-ribosylglycohydrolase family protein [Fictibacillus aquaticus]OYD57633.1 ADP-ribosyl-[dinitrogen reductase] hydrolase [Fictibacillus aquaticus]